MDRLASLVRNRLVLAGAPAFEAPYETREAIAFGQALGIVDEVDVIRLALVIRGLGPILQTRPQDQALVFTVLGRRDVAPSVRLAYIESTWLGGPAASGQRE